MSNYLKTMLLLWQLGLVDTFTMIQFFINTGSQYGAIVVASAVGNFSNIGPKILLEPVFGVGTSYQFIKAAQSAAERKARIATLAAFLSTSAASVITSDPATNSAVGTAIAAQIAYMRVILVRGGSNTLSEYFLIPSLKDFAIMANPIKTTVVPSLLSLAQMEFQDNCQLISQNLFREHTARRYVQRLAQKFLMIEFSPTYMAPIASTQLNTIPLIGLTCLRVGLIGFTIFGALYLFQRAERKRYQNNEILIDVTPSK